MKDGTYEPCFHDNAYARECVECTCTQLYCPDCESAPSEKPEPGCYDKGCSCHD